MKKTITREKVIQVEENIFVCDLCEKTVEAGSACIAIKAAIVRQNGSITLENSPLMVCPDCFSGARLVLDTKRIPELRNKLEERTEKGDPLDDIFSQMNEYKKYAKYITKLSKNGVTTI